MQVVHIAKGGHVIREKSRSNHVYVLKEGEVTETKQVLIATACLLVDFASSLEGETSVFFLLPLNLKH